MSLFSIKSIPETSWSSINPLNFKPKVTTLFFLCFGLSLFGLGEALMFASGFGVSPWLVLSDGISRSTGWSIGESTFCVSVAVLLLWIPLKQMPGLGTLLNAMIIPIVIDLSLPILPQPEFILWQAAEASLGVFLVGLGSAIYLVAKLGAGPRDGLMTGLQRITNYPIAWVRTAIEISVVGLGWLLGGAVGLGTLLFALGVGPALAVGLSLVLFFSNSNSHS